MDPTFYDSLIQTTIALALDQGGDLKSVMYLNQAVDQMRPGLPEAHVEAIVQANADHVAQALASATEVIAEEMGPRKRIATRTNPNELDIKFITAAAEYLEDRARYAHWRIPSLERLQQALQNIEPPAPQSVAQSNRRPWNTSSGYYMDSIENREDPALNAMEAELSRRRLAQEIPALADQLGDRRGRAPTV